MLSTRSENRKAKNVLPANVLVTEFTSKLEARLPFPSRDATEVTVASLNIKAIISKRKTTFLFKLYCKGAAKGACGTVVLARGISEVLDARLLPSSLVRILSSSCSARFAQCVRSE